MNSSHRKHAPVAVALLLAAALVAAAQPTARPQTEWTEKQAQRLLDDSPWGHTQSFGDLYNRAFSNNRDQRIAASAINFRIRLLSAKPVRQAMSRLLLAQAKAGSDERLAAELGEFVDRDITDHIVVAVSCDSAEVRGHLQDARQLLESLTTARLEKKSYLEAEGGRRVFLREYIPPRGGWLGARFVFPRFIDHKPFVQSGDGQLRFYSELSGSYTLDARFKLKDMVYEGKLEY